MAFNWLSWENPVSLWWVSLSTISLINILMWFWMSLYLSKNKDFQSPYVLRLISLSGVYVFVCAFRSILPRADVLRICLFDTWFSSVMLGRTLATIAELCFVLQWAIVLFQISKNVDSKVGMKISKLIFPIIVIAECFSWYAVIRTHYLGNIVEESLWALTYFLIGITLLSLHSNFKGAMKFAISSAIFGSFLYVLFMTTVDVPMYIERFNLDNLNNKQLLNFFDGITNLNSHWIVTHQISDWKEEIPWMTLYFSVAVWTSLVLCFVPITKTRLLKHLK